MQLIYSFVHPMIPVSSWHVSFFIQTFKNACGRKQAQKQDRKQKRKKEKKNHRCSPLPWHRPIWLETRHHCGNSIKAGNGAWLATRLHCLQPSLSPCLSPKHWSLMTPSKAMRNRQLQRWGRNPTEQIDEMKEGQMRKDLGGKESVKKFRIEILHGETKDYRLWKRPQKEHLPEMACK